MRLLVLILLCFLALPAGADVGKFDAEVRERNPLAGYQVLVVRELADAVAKRPQGDKAPAFGAEVKAGGAAFASGLIAKFNADPARQREAVAEAPESQFAVVEGKIIDFHDGNLAQRYIGIGGRDRFRAVVEVRDGRSNALLGTIQINMKGSLVPGVGNLIQSTSNFIDGAAARVRDELLIAAGDKRRENTGRQGRLREKYSSGN
jgi:hypothetical protein